MIVQNSVQKTKEMAENNRKRNISGDFINDNRTQNPFLNNVQQVANPNSEQSYVHYVPNVQQLVPYPNNEQHYVTNNVQQVATNPNNEHYVEMNAIVPTEQQVARGNGDGEAENIERVEVRAQVHRGNGDGEAENIDERVDENAETHLLRFCQQYPIARRFLRSLSVVALVNLCVAYQSIFDFLSVENKDIRSLCECFDLVSVFRTIPRTPRILELLDQTTSSFDTQMRVPDSIAIFFTLFALSNYINYS